MPQQQQLKLSAEELERLKGHIWQDFLGAKSNHEARIERFRRYYRLWRGLPMSGDKDNGADFEVPMLKWITFGHWSRCMSALLGDDAEIIAKPTAPEDQKIAPKVGAYMTWRIFEYMRAIPGLSAWMFRTVLFGRAHAYVPYEQEYYWERGRDGEPVETLAYDGPKLIPLWPSEIILPAQDGVTSVRDFEWKIRRLRLTPQDLLDGERAGKYTGITSHWDEIYSHSQQRQERDYWWDDEKIDSDEAEGVSHATLMGNRDSIEVWQWFGKWRLPKGRKDAEEGDLKRRQPYESELLVTYLPKPGLIIGVQDLMDLYPRMRYRAPFLDIGLVKDGSYWCPGLGEMTEELQAKCTANYKLFEKAGYMSVGPVIFYRPGSGFDPKVFEYKPNVAIPTESPNDVNVVRFEADFKFCEANQQALSGFAEKVTGVSDQTLGQSIDRPNAPRTATGQMALIEQGNVRASLDMAMLREDLSVFDEHVWALDREYAPEEVFFRATEEDGLFDVDRGFGKMTPQEREHAFDFSLQFATSVYSKEAKKQEAMALYQVAVQNPLVMQNPVALWNLLNTVWSAMGNANFSAIIPKPPEQDAPKTPKVEWAEMSKGEEIHVNPLDQDDQHLIDHRRRLEQESAQKPIDRDHQLEGMAVQHILDHEAQKRQKMLLAAITQQIQQQIQTQQQAQGGLQPGQPGLNAGAQPAGGPQPPSAVPQPQPQGPQPNMDPSIAGPAGLGGPVAS